MMKRVAGIAVLVVAFMGSSQLAQAANETVEIDTTLTPRGGKLYKDLPVAVNSVLSATISAPPASVTVNPIKRSVFTFTTDMTYNPNNAVTPVCPDSKFGPQTNLALGLAAIYRLCPNSVIGTGTSSLYLGKFQAAPLKDPQLIIFNGGRDKQGNAKLKIYGFSKQTVSGILMQGVLDKQGVQDIPVPVLSSDSAVSEFVFNIPGNGIKIEDDQAPGGTRVVKGLDPNYVQAKCPSGKWTTDGDFTMGERDVATGAPTSPEFVISAPSFVQRCSGLPGKARLGGVKVKGPNAVKSGRKGTFRVTLKNTGTATARNVTVTTNRGGKGKGGNIVPGASKTVTVKVGIRGRKNQRIAVRFTARSGKDKAAATRRVKVR